MNIKGELTFDNLVALQHDSMKTIDKLRRRITTIKVIAVLLLVITQFFINPGTLKINIIDYYRAR